MSKTVATRPQIGIGGCRVSENAKRLVMEVLDSNRLSAGPMIDRFEREIAGLHDRRFGLFAPIPIVAFRLTHDEIAGDDAAVC